MRKIVYNALQTPDGTIIESTHRHDYIEYKDKNGKIYVIDGGLDYVRCSSHGDEKLLTKYADQPHEQIRDYAFRTGYGYRLTRIKDMDDDHLEGAIEYVKHFIAYYTPANIINELEDDEHPFALQILLNEKEYRNKK
jgi:hypothetical protein